MATKPKPAKTPARKRMADAQYQQLADFRYALRQFLDFSSGVARDAGLTPQQHQALLTIKGLSVSGVVNVGDIAERLLSRHHSVVELLDRLVGAELVERRLDADDKRRVHIVLTNKAERVLEKLSEAHMDELKRLRPMLRAVLGKQA
jgi:DNA-binding MarR family transcriptional regulator